ncbi:MAG: PaaI family thioesterase [Oscillospiraceae bacterium]|nr:PaaI family thioesterase [Oscillospiraceae bacterium]
MMDALEKARELLEKNSFITWIGVELAELEKDRVVLRLDSAEVHKNPYGILHGGVFYTMADTAAGTAARTDGRDYVTQSSSVNYLRSQSEGTILAEAWVRYRGRSTCVTEVNITGDDGKLLATGLMTFFCLGTDYFADALT